MTENVTPPTQTTGGTSRRSFLTMSAAGLSAVLAWPLLDTLANPSSAAAEPATGASGPASLPIAFDTGWLFGPAVDGGTAADYDDADLATVTLPHTVTPLSWREWDPATWERSWLYRKHFDAPADTTGMRTFVDFAGALTSTKLTLNGVDLPGRIGGYLPFTAEITDQLRKRGNVLAAVVDATFNQDVPPDRPGQPSSSVDFWQPGGIYRDVQLRVVPQVFIADVFAKPVNVLDPSQRAVQVQCTLDAAATAQHASVTVELRDGQRRIATTTVPVTLDQVGQPSVAATLDGLSSVTLWDIDHPHCYDVIVTLSVGGRPVHDYRTRIGFRTAEFTTEGFFLNGRRVKLFGVNRHQFFPFAGAAMPARVQRRDAEILAKELNCNMVRCSHYPQSEAFLDACDEYGLMVWHEIPGWGYFGDAAWQANAERDLHDMIVRDRNHPSIIVWGAMPNESGNHPAQYTSWNQLAHSLDDSRPTGGDDLGFGAGASSYEFDVYSHHDYSSHIGPDGKKVPDLAPPTDAAGKPYLVTETVGTLSGPAIYYRRTDAQAAQQGEATAHARVHDLAAADDAYCGVLAWSGYDYPSGSGNQYRGTKYTGVVDLFRIPKPGAAIYEAQVDPRQRPVIAPAFYWDFGPTSPITALGPAMICSNLDRLEIYVGGRHFASVTPDITDYGHLRYPPSFVDFSTVDGASKPDLRIDGYIGRRRVTSRPFSADPRHDRLWLALDDDEIVGDGVDATRLTIRAVDRFGAPRPYVTGDVSLFFDGAIRVVGDQPVAFAETGGASAVWLRSLRNSPGSVTVTAAHPTLGRARASLHVSRALPGGPPEPYGTVAATPPTVLAEAATSVTVSATFTNSGLPRLRDIDLTLHVPDGWTVRATTATHLRDLAPGERAAVSWQLAVPAGTAPQRASADIEAVYRAGGERGVTHASVAMLVPYASLAAAYNNTAISHDADVDEANFDGVGNSYSFEALAAAGVRGGAQLDVGGAVVTWPDLPAGVPDDALAAGQTFALTGSGTKLALIGSASPLTSGSGTIYYSDGSTDEFTVTFDDYFYPPTVNQIVASEPYVNSQGLGGRQRGQRKQTIYLYGTTVDIAANKQVVGVTLPKASSTGSGRISGMHVFAAQVGG